MILVTLSLMVSPYGNKKYSEYKTELLLQQSLENKLYLSKLKAHHWFV